LSWCLATDCVGRKPDLATEYTESTDLAKREGAEVCHSEPNENTDCDP